mgnify:CR=1 FL=1
MALDPGLGGMPFKPAPTQSAKPLLISQPVPTDPTLSGDREYLSPISSGEAAEPITTVTTPVSYTSASRVIDAYRNRASTGMTYVRAVDILMTQFGFSQTDAEDMLGPELTTPVFTQPEDEETIIIPSPPIYDFFPHGQQVSFTRIVGIAALAVGFSFVSQGMK